MSDKKPATKTNLMEFIAANGYLCVARAEIVDDTQPCDVWAKFRATGRVHVELSFDGEACIEPLTHTPEDEGWR